MAHRYPTRYQTRMTQTSPVPSKDDQMVDEETVQQDSVRQDSAQQDSAQHDITTHQQRQEHIFALLVPHQMRKAVEIILVDCYDEKIYLTPNEKKEAEQIYSMINASMTNRFQKQCMTYHYPIICRLHSNIELFTYIKHNYELVRRFHYLANIYHSYYDHFTALYSTLWSKCIDPEYMTYKDTYLPYCTLLSTIKDIIHTGEMIFIKERILKYY